MKRTLKRLLCGFLVIIMCVTMLPIQTFAWSYMSHMNSANIIRMEMMSYDSPSLNLSIQLHESAVNDYGFSEYNCTIPDEFYTAIINYPDAFRAGSLGPDFYPDLFIGQMYIHPYDYDARVGSGEWLALLIESVNRLPKYDANRLRALSFTLGFMLHYCGDMFGHDFINTFSGGTFPSVTEANILDTKDLELNNILSHMSMESYMDDLVNKDFYDYTKQIEIDAPDRFVADSLLLDSNIPAGAAKIFDEFGGSAIYIEEMLNLRKGVMDFADKYRPSTDPILMGLSSYADQWALDIDAGIYGLVDTFDRIAHRLVTGDPNPEIEAETIKDWVLNGYPLSEMLDDMWNLPGMSETDVGVIKEELSFWLDEYGWELIGIPSWLVDPPIPDWLKESWDWIMAPIKIPLARVKELLCGLFAGLLDAAVGGFVELGVEFVERYDDRLEKPSVQLDHEDNPYRPSGTNNFEEFDAFMDIYESEQALLNDYDLISLITNSDGEDVLAQLTDSEFEAFYNTMTMFKLILMGPEYFTRFLNYCGIENQTAYRTNTGEIEATVLRLDVKTMDMQWAGTDDNVWAIVKSRSTGEEVTRKLLDTSITNNLECGDNNTFFVELPGAMKLTDIDLYLKQEGTWTTDGGWDCESVTVTPMHAGYATYHSIGLGGNLEMDAGVTWDLQFHTALIFRTNGLKVTANTPVTHVEVRIKTGNGDYDSGTDQDVKLVALDREKPEDYMVEVDLDKYLYDDFEDGDDDTYMVPLGQFDKATQKNKYPALGDVTLLLAQFSDYDWYVKNVTVTPYYGNLQLTQTMDFGSGWIKESDETIVLSPSLKINDGTIVLYGYDGFPLTYETALDDGLLSGMRSLDAGEQWENVHVLWKSTEGRKLFFNLFKGFGPEISIKAGTVEENSDYNISLSFSGVWNGINEARREAVYDMGEMPAVNGTAKITFINASTGAYEQVLSGVRVANNKAQINSVTHNLNDIPGSNVEGLNGVYHIKVEYTPDSQNPQYGKSEVLFRNALVVNEVNRYAVTTRAICEGVPVTSKFLADLDVYGTVTGAGVYASGTRFKVTATPNTGYKIKEWRINQIEDGIITRTDKVSSMPNNTFSGTSQAGIDADFVIVFEPETYTIKIATNDDLGLAGTVEGAGTYKHGERGTITATPNEGFVFTGWYLDGHLLSTKQSLAFTATKDANFTANFAVAATVKMSGGTDCGYGIYVDSADTEALDSLLNSGRISKEDIRSLNADKAGTSFDVAKDSTVTFKVEIKEGYEKTGTFKVTARSGGRDSLPVPLSPNAEGKYTCTVAADTTISISGVRKIEPTPTPELTYMEFEDGSIVFQSFLWEEEEGVVTLTLCVNGKTVTTVEEIAEYILTKEELERHGGLFSVYATAQAEGKPISERATLNNGSGSDIVVPVDIEDTENGTVVVDEEYNAPGTKAKLTVTPETGYALHKLTVTYDAGGEEVEVDITDNSLIETTNEKGEIVLESMKEDGVYYFDRPAGKVTVRALFAKRDNSGDTNEDGKTDSTDAELMAKYFAGYSKEELGENFNPYSADMDGNGEITRKDAMILARIAAGWTTNIGE